MQAEGALRRLAGRRGGAGHAEEDRRAGPRRAAHADVTTVAAHDAERDVEAEADPARIAAPVALEQVAEVIRRDARAGVVHGEADQAALLLRLHHDAAPGRRELERVSDQVAQDLQDALPI